MRRGSMVKVLSWGLVLTVALAPAAGAKKKPTVKTTRTETHTYSGPTAFSLATVSLNTCIQDQGCFTLTPQSKEEYVSILVTDQSGQPVALNVSTDDGGGLYCGETSSPIWLNGADQVNVTLGAALPDCTGVATTGSFDATFSNLP